MEVVKNLKKELKNKSADYDDITTINIKAEDKKAIFSEYNYDSNEILNSNLSDFIMEKERDIPLKSQIRVKIFTNDDVNEKEVEMAYRNKFKNEFQEQEQELKKNLLFALIMLVLGVLFMGFLILELYLLNDFIFSTVLEIAAWVFIWEAVDSFFLRRSEMRRIRFHLARLYYAELEIVKLDFEEVEKHLQKSSNRNI